MRRLGRREAPARVGLDDFAQRLTAGIGEFQVRGAQPAGVGLTPDVGAGEADGLLLGKSQHLDRKGQGHPASPQFRQHHDRQKHSQRPVESTGIAHGVEVGADQQGLGFGVWRLGFSFRGFEPSDQVASLVLANGEAGLAHPTADELVRALHRRGQKRPRQPARLIRHPAELVEHPDEFLLLCLSHRGQLPRYVLYPHGVTSSGTW